MLILHEVKTVEVYFAKGLDFRDIPTFHVELDTGFSQAVHPSNFDSRAKVDGNFSRNLIHLKRVKALHVTTSTLTPKFLGAMEFSSRSCWAIIISMLFTAAHTRDEKQSNNNNITRQIKFHSINYSFNLDSREYKTTTNNLLLQRTIVWSLIKLNFTPQNFLHSSCSLSKKKQKTCSLQLLSLLMK